MKAETIHGQRLEVYDNGGKTFDRYTVVFMDEMEGRPNQTKGRGNLFCALGMSERPTHPQGFGQHTTAQPGSHLGRRIAFERLPDDCRRLVIQDVTTAQP